MTQLIAGNWKMNGLRDALPTITEIGKNAPSGVDTLICPPMTLLSEAIGLNPRPSIGAQDCHAAPSGAHTGDTSAAMIADAGATHVIVGHSERRANHGETDAAVAAKAKAAHDAGLTAIICIGETEAERDDGRTLDVLRDQLIGSVPSTATASNTEIAYEPVWAIGTGKTASVTNVREAHVHIRQVLSEIADQGSSVRILYGGSVKPDNASELLAVEEVGGALVGGASLKASDFLAICNAARL